MKPNFEAMTLKEIRAYVLENRQDKEAFRAYMDKLDTEVEWVTYPPLKSVEDLDNYPDFLERVRRSSPGNS